MCQILIVEDETRLAALLQKGLQKYGFTSVTAATGKQALQVMAQKPIALLLLDLGLPVMDGWSVLRELRRQGNTCPIIILTAQGDDQKKSAALAAGANAFIPKPFRFDELITCVRSHLNPTDHA